MFNVLKDKLGNILNPIIPRYEIKYIICTKIGRTTSAYTHNAGGYRIGFGKPETFNDYPTNKKILAIIPLGIYYTNDVSVAGALTYDANDTLWGVGIDTNNHTARILVIYR